MSDLANITETFVRVGEKTFMESSLRPGEWREVPVFLIRFGKTKRYSIWENCAYSEEERLVTTEEQRLLSA